MIAAIPPAWAGPEARLGMFPGRNVTPSDQFNGENPPGKGEGFFSKRQTHPTPKSQILPYIGVPGEKHTWTATKQHRRAKSQRQN